MRNWLRFIVLTLISLSVLEGFAQNEAVLVKGKVYNEFGSHLFTNLFVVNKRTRQGNFANPSGDYSIRVKKSDTVLIGSNGYMTYRLAIPDTFQGDVYETDVHLKRLQYTLREAKVFAQRDIDKIYEDIEKLGYDPKEFRVATGVNALSSPITALYYAFSRRVKQEELAYELMNEARRKELLKELFVKYVSADIIDLDEKEFDDFIDFCNVSDEFLQKASQYEFIEYVKQKYQLYVEVTKYDEYYMGE